jgi:2',3'-cyclic-nucleotide 2'-phosphodiesterase (5'-nucleotidase family)
VLVNGAPLDPDRMYSLAIPSFLLLGGDGYGMFEGQRVAVSPETGPTIPAAIERYVSGRDVAPATEGRIRIAR